ncbi:MAG: hypothetical protein AB7U23_13195 [Dehalococcoidia bacterium]
MNTTKTCVIKRTGRRATGELVTLPSGRVIRLNATGSHVEDLTDEDIIAVRKVADTLVVVREETAGPPGYRSDQRIAREEQAPAPDSGAGDEAAPPAKRAKKREA